MKPQEGERGRGKVPPVTKHEVARLPRRTELALEERESLVIVERPDESRPSGERSLRERPGPDVQAGQRREPE